MKRNLIWVVMHSSLMLAVVLSLLSGLRIATLDSPALLRYSALLPQGDVHSLHLIGGTMLLALLVAYVVYCWVFPAGSKKTKSKPKSYWYHYVVIHLGYFALLGLIVTGLSVYFNWFNATDWHFYLALVLLVYLPLHAFVYFVQYGIKAIRLITVPELSKLKVNLAIVSVTAILAVVFNQYFERYSYQGVPVKAIDLSQGIRLDGVADEPQWQGVPEVVVDTYGGANFVDGRTTVRVKALENGVEAYFHMVWDDPEKSLKHLPLIKTSDGWQVQESGFYKFDETKYYEDKFAVIVSDNCQFGAADTAHLGPRPISDKPPNFSGKGYHYSKGEQLVDLWHWKAVRTNAMVLADDNFIGPPDIERPGSRRYTAGYMPDGKEAGAYVMNWQWYNRYNVTPKRLPKEPKMLAPYQNALNDGTSAAEADWVIPWFGYQPYSKKVDDLPIGTVMPSVMYRSNRFEGDRADVRAHAVWRDGQWSLELSRKLDTGSDHDVTLGDGVCLWVAAFDHAQISHTRHNRPLKLKFARALL